jgi:5,5'-dehydrodivanillate O-demethylase
MLSVTENERLSRVGKGTPMGELMRRYWHPIAAAAELDDRPTKPVRLLGEDLVLYRDRSGTLGLIERVCPHRRVDLSYGIPEEHGLRCMYHGWLYDETGQCIEQPFEETVHPDGRFKEKVKVAGYPVEEMAGLIFAYLGPQPAPLVPRWEQLLWDNAVRDIAISEIPCNWLQCQENSLDPVHVQWLHAYMGAYVNSDRNTLTQAGSALAHQKIGFDEFEYGIIKRRLLLGKDYDDDEWKEGHPVLFPNILLVGNDARATFQFRVPVDDEHTLHVSIYNHRAAPGATAPTQDVVPYRYVPLKDENDRYILEWTFNQDYMAWITQGPIAARDKEVLGESDVGIILFRKQLKRNIAVMEDGADPMNVFRGDPGALLRSPVEKVKFGLRAATRYVPPEAGESKAVPDIEKVLATWQGFENTGN